MSDQTRVELWTAFSGDPTGGSPAGIVRDASSLNGAEMQRIATAVGAPATGFVMEVSGNHVHVRFFSTQTEYGMCGHGTIALLTALVTDGTTTGSIEPGAVTISTGSSGGTAHVEARAGGRYEVLLDLDVPPIEKPDTDLSEVFAALGTPITAVAVSRSDFVHLLVPLPLDAIAGLSPDFGRLDAACRAAGIETVATYATETVHDDAHIHTRDFCPAVGTSEAAATGTTNRAVVAHVVASSPERFDDGMHTVTVEQGLEMGRPSRVRARFSVANQELRSIAVGGVATFLEELVI